MSEDTAPAESTPAPPMSGPPDELSALRAQFEAQAQKLDEVLRAYSRLQQDKDDFRRRAEREKERVLEAERSNVAMALLEAVDQLDLALGAVPVHPSADAAALAQGVKLVREGLLKRVEQSGLVRFSAVGEPFDPNVHEAIALVDVDTAALAGKVVSEVRAGYRQGDRVVRPARVTVGKGFADGASDGNK